MQGELLISSLKLLLALLVVILLAYISLKFTNTYLSGQNQIKNIQVIERVPIHNKSSLCLVKIGEKYMVIGVSENNFQVLKTLEENEIKNWKIQNGKISFAEAFHFNIKNSKKGKRKND